MRGRVALEPLSLQLWPLVSGRDIDKLQEQGRKQEQNKQNHSCDFLFSSVKSAWLEDRCLPACYVRKALQQQRKVFWRWPHLELFSFLFSFWNMSQDLGHSGIFPARSIVLCYAMTDHTFPNS